MGNHRPKITADFEMHGHKAHFDFGWCNWSPNGDGVDQRVIDWFREQAEIAMNRWRADVEAYHAERDKEEIEKSERDHLAKLKAKYEPPQ